MTATTQILRDYLARLESELPFGKKEKREILLEAEDHLIEDAQRDEASGMDADEAERRATRRFGEPQALARRFAEERAPAIELVNADSGGVFDLQQGTVYPILHRLEQEDLIKSRWVSHAGRQRREYEITSDGRDRLDAARADWKRFSRGVRGVIGEAT